MSRVCYTSCADMFGVVWQFGGGLHISGTWWPIQNQFNSIVWDIIISQSVVGSATKLMGIYRFSNAAGLVQIGSTITLIIGGLYLATSTHAHWRFVCSVFCRLNNKLKNFRNEISYWNSGGFYLRVLDHGLMENQMTDDHRTWNFIMVYPRLIQQIWVKLTQITKRCKYSCIHHIRTQNVFSKKPWWAQKLRRSLKYENANDSKQKAHVWSTLGKPFRDGSTWQAVFQELSVSLKSLRSLCIIPYLKKNQQSQCCAIYANYCAWRYLSTKKSLHLNII